jgi:4a-hydroxytetrahydrobiopterin dehydratase
MPQLLSDDEINQRLRIFDGWVLSPDKTSIRRECEFDSFKVAVCFFNEVAKLAEEFDHHPDIFSSYRTVKIELSTHDAHGLTELDFNLAEKIDQVIRKIFEQ